MTGKVLELEVELEWIEPRIWRRFRIPSDVSLGDLHVVLQLVMGWTDSHLHMFQLKDGRRASDEGQRFSGLAAFGLEEDLDEDEISLAEAFPRVRSKLLYEYDFGDGWRHVVRLVARVNPADLSEPLPHAVAGARACPLEDSGGPGGHETLVRALADEPEDEWAEELLDWVDDDYDPEEFSLAEVNKLLKRYCQPKAAKKKTAKKATAKKKTAKKKKAQWTWAPRGS